MLNVNEKVGLTFDDIQHQNESSLVQSTKQILHLWKSSQRTVILQIKREKTPVYDPKTLDLLLFLDHSKLSLESIGKGKLHMCSTEKDMILCHVPNTDGDHAMGTYPSSQLSFFSKKSAILK